MDSLSQTSVCDVSLSPSDTLIAAATTAGSVLIFNLDDGRHVLSTVFDLGSFPSKLLWIDDATLAVGTVDGFVSILEVVERDGKASFAWPFHTSLGRLTVLLFSGWNCPSQPPGHRGPPTY